MEKLKLDICENLYVLSLSLYSNDEILSDLFIQETLSLIIEFKLGFVWGGQTCEYGFWS